MKAQFTILYLDDTIIAVDKPAGVLAIPDHWDPEVPVAQNMLAKQYGALFPVHRIDKDTTGVLLYARTQEAHHILNELFSSRQVGKVYLAIVSGEPERDAWEIDAPLLPDGDRMHRTVIDALKGKPARTKFEVVERFRGFALVRALPETGRTHQIRVHLAASRLPILADALYGNAEPLMLSKLKRRWKGDVFEEKPVIARLALHASSVEFAHPKTGERLRIESPLPRDFKAALNQLRKWRAI